MTSCTGSTNQITAIFSKSKLGERLFETSYLGGRHILAKILSVLLYNMEALYKMKKPKTGQADRGVRARMKDTASKKSRANLLDSKRRIPLSEVQPSSNNNIPGMYPYYF